MWHGATHLLQQFELLPPAQVPYELQHHLCLHICKLIKVSERCQKKAISHVHNPSVW
jgi:hypothetical protein